MKPRLILVGLCLALGALVGGGLRAGAQGKTETKDEAAKVRDEIATSEQQVSRQFDDFVQALLKLKQRLERSEKKDDRERAKVLEKVLDETKNANVSLRLERLTAFLRSGKLSNLDDIRTAQTQSQEIADSLNLLLRLMREDPRHKQLQDTRKQLQALIEQLDKVIHREKNVEAQARIGKTDSKELEATQKRLANETAKIAKDLDRIMGRNDPGEDARKLKGENKDGGKGDGKKAEAKDLGKKDDAAKGESKDGGKDSQAAKADAKGGEPGQGEKGGRAPEKKDDAPAQAKAGDGAEKKDGGAKESKGAQAAKGEPKAGGPPGDGKPGEAKSGSDSKGQAQAKDGGQPKEGQPSAGQQASSKDGGQPPAGQQAPSPQPPQAPKDDVAQSKKRIQDGNYEQRQAEEKLAKKENPKAADHADKAVDHLQKAKEKLEKLLRQMREEEMERLLAALQARCEKMLAMQQQVLAGTETVHKAIESNEGKKPKHENKQESIRLSDQEKEIVSEASKAIEMLEAEGSAVAFPEVFQQVREDMKHVQRRLELTDVAQVTQTIERDIIDSLKEMIEALKKARQELDNKNNSPPSEGGPPPDQKLLDQIAELKMIRSLQIRVNTRTTTYGRMYEGEQAAAPNIRQEIQNLAERQERIFDITHRIAKGENR